MLKFRKDIGGLRAIAVLAVVLYHFSVPGFSGGFSGVDIFFVISGYLMTGIIFSKVSSGNFSLLGFYLDRARRIIPALLFVSLVLLVVGYCALLPADYEFLARHIRSSLLFFSNVEYYDSINYFDTSAKEKWLLHTWSLSVEWQFYMVYPIIIMGIIKAFGQKSVKYVISALALASFVSSVYLSKTDQGAAFYLLSSRAWEMMVGGLAFLLPGIVRDGLKSPVKYFSLIAALAGVYLLNSAMQWPGELALIPVASTFLIIYAGDKDNVILDNVIFQWIGKISYSIYLVHWPIAVYMSINNISGMEYSIIAIISSVLLGAASFYLVENPVRKALSSIDVNHKRTELAYIAIPLCVVLGASWSVLNMNGLPSRFQFATMTSEQLKEQMNRYWVDGDKPHPVPKTGDKKIVIIGNSHGIDLTYALTENGMKGDITYVRTTNLCSNFGYTPNDMPYVEKCKEVFSSVLTTKDIKDADVVIMHDDFGRGDLFGMLYAIKKISELTKAKIYVFGPKMQFTEQPMEIINHASKAGINSISAINDFSSRFYKSDRIKINSSIMDYMKGGLPSFEYIDTLSIQCGDKMGCKILSDDGKYLYFDISHFTLEGAIEFGKKLKEKHPELF